MCGMIEIRDRLPVVQISATLVIDVDNDRKLLLNGIVIKSHSSCLGCWVM